MPNFISLVKWTDQGIRNIKESPERLDKARDAFEKNGAKLKDFYLSLGQYDMIIFSEAPDAETIAKVWITAGTAGAVRTETFQVFTEEAYRDIIASVK
ncbi:GYD domain-containing protein [Desulfococcaceae bacterium HSG8]|nr:GYD domain-containing protein [Desulfococcaceae bacterium HSG8]